MTRKTNIAIIGAGTAGLAALKEVNKATDEIVMIDPGPLGTTCAQTGCMPSKTLIQVANDFHRRNTLRQQGILGHENITIDIKQAMEHVRQLRDYFTNSVLKSIEPLKHYFIQGKAELLAPNLLQVDDTTIQANKIIIAAGSHSIVPDAWKAFSDRILTSETLFEQDKFADPLAVIGAGVIGLELGQALSRLGLQVHVLGNSQFIGGLTDPVVNQTAVEILQQEMPLYLGSQANVIQQNETLHVTNDNQEIKVHQLIASMGRKSNAAKLNMGSLGIELDKNGLPHFNPETLQVNELPIFIAGDSNSDAPLLHEASDEGRIAGFNAVHEEPHCFQRRTPLTIVYSQPHIAIVGQSYNALKNRPDFIYGEASFADQGRARIMQQNAGFMRVYGEKQSGKLLGAELVAPEGEHIAHLLAWTIQQQLTVFDVLQFPFYHPTIEEGLRTALRNLADKVKTKHADFELAMCDSSAEMGLN